MKETFISAAIVVPIFAIIAVMIIGSNKRSVQRPSIVVIEGCQYLCWDIYMGYRGYTHKGNCTNAIHW